MAKATTSKNQLPPVPPNRLRSVFDDPPRNTVFLLSCMDQRLLDDTSRFMNELNLQNRYDHLALAGGAMGVLRLPANPSHESATWWNVFTTHLTAAINVLGRSIKDIFLLDHLDCGAYKKLHPDDGIANEYANASLRRMRELHAAELAALARKVDEFCRSQCQPKQSQNQGDQKDRDEKGTKWKDIRISCFVLDLRGRVIQLGVDTSRSSRSARRPA